MAAKRSSSIRSSSWCSTSGRWCCSLSPIRSSASMSRPAPSWSAILIALAISYAMTRHIAVMPLVTAVIVLVFGGLTLVLHDELFIKLKPTIIYVLFGGTLVGGLAVRQAVARDGLRLRLPSAGGRLAQADVAMGAVFLRACDPERDRLAHADHRFLGELQTVRRGAAHLSFRRAASIRC